MLLTLTHFQSRPIEPKPEENIFNLAIQRSGKSSRTVFVGGAYKITLAYEATPCALDYFSFYYIIILSQLDKNHTLERPVSTASRDDFLIINSLETRLLSAISNFNSHVSIIGNKAIYGQSN